MYCGPLEGQSFLAEPAPALSKSQPLEWCGVCHCLLLELQSACPGLHAAGNSWHEIWSKRKSGRKGCRKGKGKRERDKGKNGVRGRGSEAKSEMREEKCNEFNKNSAMWLCEVFSQEG